MVKEQTLDIYAMERAIYGIGKATFEGKGHLIVPVVMMVEGVHQGSHGALFHPAEELGRFEAAWNGIPVTISHPKDLQGNYVSANAPDVLQGTSVGRVFNTRMENNKLKADVWLEENKIASLSPQALAYIRQGKPLEVSVGVFTDEESIQGEYNGKQYTAIARNHRPDHLALLPGETGACSWQDGCGIRNNSQIKKKGGKMNEEDIVKQKDEAVKQALLMANSMGLQELFDQIRRTLDSMDTQEDTHYLEEVYDDYIIFRSRKRGVENGAMLYYRQGYVENEDGIVQFVEEPIQVVKKVSYLPVSQNGRVRRNVSNNSNKEGVNMSKEKSSCFLGKVEKVLTNRALGFAEQDKEWLLQQDEVILDKLLAVKEGMQVNMDEVTQTLKKTVKTAEDVLRFVPEEMQDSIKTGMQLYADKRKGLVDAILANTKAWAADELNAMTTEFLTKIEASTVKGDADYSLNGGEQSLQNNSKQGEDILIPIL